jgi:hypothetical protein
MSEKNRRPGVRDNDTDHSGDSPSRTTPAAKRRLLRALGGTGGIALGVLLGARWHKPVVKAVVLPAHAQASPVEEMGCLISVSAAVRFVSAGVGTMQIVAQDGSGSTELGNVEIQGSTTLLGSSTFPTGTYTVGVAMSTGGIARSLDVSWSCCDDTASANLTPSDGGATLFRSADISDDAQCELF